jgi:putrescine aminotransferase
VARELEAKIDELGEDRVAAFIAEPVQGAGGVIIPPDSYWPELQRICSERDILLIADEVICGFGRTGNGGAARPTPCKPDLITFAKAVTNGYMPLGGVLIGDKVADVLLAGGGEFAHGLTYSGHPASCAAGLATLQILERRHRRACRPHLAPYFQDGLSAFEAITRSSARCAAAAASPRGAGARQGNPRAPGAGIGAAVFCRDTANEPRPDGAPDRRRHDHGAAADLRARAHRLPHREARRGPGRHRGTTAFRADCSQCPQRGAEVRHRCLGDVASASPRARPA